MMFCIDLLFSALYILVLLASACCCSLLKPASHAPVLFHRHTNLQQLLDLRGNLSAQGISCHMCSGKTGRQSADLTQRISSHSHLSFPPGTFSFCSSGVRIATNSLSRVRRRRRCLKRSEFNPPE